MKTKAGTLSAKKLGIDLHRNLSKGVMRMSTLEIHVLTGKNQQGDYVSHSVVVAKDPNAMIRASMIESGAKAAAVMATGHTRAISSEIKTYQTLSDQTRRLLGE